MDEMNRSFDKALSDLKNLSIYSTYFWVEIDQIEQVGETYALSINPKVPLFRSLVNEKRRMRYDWEKYSEMSRSELREVIEGIKDGTIPPMDGRMWMVRRLYYAKLCCHPKSKGII